MMENKHYRIKPIRNESLVFWRDDENKKSSIHKGNDDLGSLVCFNKKQVWEVYSFFYGEKMWNCERKGLVIRLHEKDFKRIFGNSTT